MPPRFAPYISLLPRHFCLILSFILSLSLSLAIVPVSFPDSFVCCSHTLMMLPIIYVDTARLLYTSTHP